MERIQVPGWQHSCPARCFISQNPSCYSVRVVTAALMQDSGQLCSNLNIYQKAHFINPESQTAAREVLVQAVGGAKQEFISFISFQKNPEAGNSPRVFLAYKHLGWLPSVQLGLSSNYICPENPFLKPLTTYNFITVYVLGFIYLYSTFQN